MSRLQNTMGARARSVIASSTVELDRLILDAGTQPRESMLSQVVESYAQRMRVDDRGFVVDPEGQDWTKIEVVESADGRMWLVDGFHRVAAARAHGITSFQANVTDGDARRAVELSLGANARHGERRTNADKRRVVAFVLRDSQWCAYSDNRIAKMCAVSQPFVGKMRKELVERGEIEVSHEISRADGSTQERPRRRTRRAPQGAPSMRATIAYPTSSSEWEALATSFDPLEGVLLCALEQGTPHLFDGPHRLSLALGDVPSRILLHSTHRRYFAVFGPNIDALPDPITSQHFSHTSVIGASLDPWNH